MPKSKVGLGICLYNRPDYFEQIIPGIEKVLPKVDVAWAYNDGSTKSYKKVYEKKPKKLNIMHNPKNKGVARAKNWLLKKLMDEGCDYMFILEEDIILDSPKAITEYVRLSKLSGIEHFLFAHHGEANVDMLYTSKGGVDCWTACVGAYGMYTRNVIETCGYFDENMFNAFEHIEHSYRIQKAGLTTPYPLYPDLTKSREYMHEIPGSIEKSSIRVRKDWQLNIVKALLYWQKKDKDFPLSKMLEKALKQIEEQG